MAVKSSVEFKLLEDKKSFCKSRSLIVWAKWLCGNTFLLNDLAIILSGHERDLYAKIKKKKKNCDFPAVEQSYRLFQISFIHGLIIYNTWQIIKAFMRCLHQRNEAIVSDKLYAAPIHNELLNVFHFNCYLGVNRELTLQLLTGIISYVHGVWQSCKFTMHLSSTAAMFSSSLAFGLYLWSVDTGRDRQPGWFADIC